ncbi:hypothetical protein AMJ39_08095 [candidate division TA06 bacterium DG_24]|jgi:ribosomal protein L37E|uniref:Uncharacterized protein n=2 Tax=Bacteria division TA06 TaxID=1156500 RepID=A0A0S8G877_UNCT6|nr:MAG: hypothetical protein AMJ39_08095 [candidate division TA06 bacterium DG_24]KPK68801.1 MAG: hypothetical protein AMJ82_07285 [candidate division TA06 bacterium SM23_40]
MEERCRRCNEIMFESWPIETGAPLAQDPTKPTAEFVNVDEEELIQCRHCGALHRFREMTGQPGARGGFEIIGLKDGD